MTTLTGVGWHFSAAHRSRHGVLHGHTWEVVVWWLDKDDDANRLQSMLRACLVEYDHTELPEELSRGENLARKIGLTLAEENMFGDIHSVEVSRPAERIYAKWFAA